MNPLPESLKNHRVRTGPQRDVVQGEVTWEPVRSIWFIAMAVGAAVGGALNFSWSGVAVFLVSTVAVLLFGHSLGMHRKLIHNSYGCPKWLEYLLVYCGVLVGMNGPLGMIRAHELRDYAQRLPDCHDYLRHGRSMPVDAWWQLNCELKLDRPPRIGIEARIANDKIYRWMQQTWMAQQLPWALLFFAIGGWSWVFWGVCARVTAGVFGHWLIGYFAHNHGQRHYEVRDAAVQGHNIRFASLLTMGECWHNNHHAYPGSARLGLHPGEWDPGWWMLLGLQKLGIAWDLRLPEDLPERSELEALTSLHPVNRG
jgi:stearoyl-CoA desaturase (delta-9 desaturase)